MSKWTPLPHKPDAVVSGGPSSIHVPVPAKVLGTDSGTDGTGENNEIVMVKEQYTIFYVTQAYIKKIIFLAP